MSNQSIETISSCEIIDSSYGMLKPQSPELSQKSEVVCGYSFKETVKAGTVFVITGVVLKSCERFSINFLASSGKHCDIAMHFNPRLPQSYIVRNSKISGHWLEEETFSQFSSRYDLMRGQRFSIEILITDSEFLMSVNGKMFGSYNHRIPYRKINAIEVKGDVKECAIDQMYHDVYPQVPIDDVPSTEPEDSGLIVPYMANIPGYFSKNKVLHIFGRVKLLPHAITINLQQKPFHWPHPIVPLHINPRFSNQGGHHIICRNAWIDKKWQKEERTDLNSIDLAPGKNFEMTIEVSFDSYIIHLNGKFFAEFSFRCNPNDVALVDTVNIFGDVALKKVWVESKKFD